MNRRRWVWVSLGVAVLVIATIALLLRGSDTTDEGILPREQFVTSYRIVYDVEEFDTPGRSEERMVKRPYLSKIVSRRGDAVLGGSITNRAGRWMLIPEQESWQNRISGRVPADDTRPIDALEAAARDGRAEATGTDVVVGRRCSVVRIGGFPGGPIEKPTVTDYTELCVDRTGVILRERWVVDGKQARRMIAASFTPGLKLDDGDFRPEPEGPPPPEGVAGLGKVRALGPGEPLPIEVRSVGGFRADGPPVAVERELSGRGPDVTYQQMFTRGARLVVVEQGVVAPGSAPRGDRVGLSPGVTGHLDLGLTANTLTVVTGSGTYVRLRGADVDALLDFGRDLASRLD